MLSVRVLARVLTHVLFLTTTSTQSRMMKEQISTQLMHHKYVCALDSAPLVELGGNER